MMDDPYVNLANAIVLQAARDYRGALRQLKRNQQFTTAKHTIREIERFFHSQWFHFLTEIDPDDLIHQLARAES